MKTILRLLMQHEPNSALTDWWTKIRKWQDAYAYDYHQNRLTVPWAMHQVAMCTKGKPYAFATDVGQHQMWAALHLRIEEPRTG